MLRDDKTKITVFIAVFYILWLARVFLIPKTTSEEMNLIISVALKFMVLVIVLVWGIIENLLVKKSNSLWASIIPHGVWDSAVHILGF